MAMEGVKNNWRSYSQTDRTTSNYFWWWWWWTCMTTVYGTAARGRTPGVDGELHEVVSSLTWTHSSINDQPAHWPSLPRREQKVFWTTDTSRILGWTVVRWSQRYPPCRRAPRRVSLSLLVQTPPAPPSCAQSSPNRTPLHPPASSCCNHPPRHSLYLACSQLKIAPPPRAPKALMINFKKLPFVPKLAQTIALHASF